MKNHMILGIIVVLLFGIIFTSVVPLPGGIIIFFLLASSSLVTVIGVVLIKEMSRRMFPVRVRFWEERDGSVVITEDTRAKRVKKDNVEYYETIGGRLIKAPLRKNIIRGERGNFIDLVIADEMVLPFKPTIRIDEDGKDGKAKFNIIPEDQRVWLANQIEANTKVTEPPLSRLQQIMPVVTLITAVGLIIGMFIVVVDQWPKFMKEMVVETTAPVRDAAQDFTESVERLERAVGGTAGSGNQGDTIPPPPY